MAQLLPTLLYFCLVVWIHLGGSFKGPLVDKPAPTIIQFIKGNDTGAAVQQD